MIPEIAGTDLDASRRPVVRMARDAERPLPADFSQDLVGALVGADVLFDVQRNDVRVLVAADPVLRDLGAGNDEHPVALRRPLRLRPDIGEVSGKIARA
jgi:hypothetical protein